MPTKCSADVSILYSLLEHPEREHRTAGTLLRGKHCTSDADGDTTGCILNVSRPWIMVQQKADEWPGEVARIYSPHSMFALAHRK